MADVGTVRAHVDANYSSGFYSQGSDLVKTRPYWQINARLSLGEVRMAGGGPELEFALWGKNLTDERHEIFEFPLTGSGLITGEATHYNEPRTYGLEARIRF